VGSSCTIPGGGGTGTVELTVASDGGISFSCGAPVKTCPDKLPSYPGSTTSCSGGVLSLTCDVHVADIDGVITNGCEDSLDTDPQNCGAIGAVAGPYPHGVAGCDRGMPVMRSCDVGWYDVNGMASDGCEVQQDGLPGSFASATDLGMLDCGQSLTRPGNNLPVGSDDWLTISANPGGACPELSVNLSGSGIVYDVIRGGAAPPAAAADSGLAGAHVFPGRITIRIHAVQPGFASYTLTAAPVA
jgi:hypothetical protein